MQEVIAALGAICDDTQAVVIAGEGPAFSAGHDLAEMLDRDEPASTTSSSTRAPR